LQDCEHDSEHDGEAPLHLEDLQKMLRVRAISVLAGCFVSSCIEKVLVAGYSIIPRIIHNRLSYSKLTYKEIILSAQGKHSWKNKISLKGGAYNRFFSSAKRWSLYTLDTGGIFGSSCNRLKTLNIEQGTAELRRGHFDIRYSLFDILRFRKSTYKIDSYNSQGVMCG